MATTPKPGIKILSETPGPGPEIRKGDRVRIIYDVLLNKGDLIHGEAQVDLTVGDRQHIAGFLYGLEGMRAGGVRKFKAGPHLCYRDQAAGPIPANAALIFDIKHLAILPSAPSESADGR